MTLDIWLCTNCDLRTTVPIVDCPSKKCRRCADAGLGGDTIRCAARPRPGAGKDGRTLVSATAGQAQDQRDLAERLGMKPGHVVQEIGYDDDCDDQLRELSQAGKTSS